MTFADPETLLVPLTNCKSIADSIERLIDLLDAMSPDPDLEDTADDEPSLGWGGNGLAVLSCPVTDGRGSAHDDRERDDSDWEPDSEGEPLWGRRTPSNVAGKPMGPQRRIDHHALRQQLARALGGGSRHQPQQGRMRS